MTRTHSRRFHREWGGSEALFLLALCATIMVSGTTLAVEAGSDAPDFTLTDLNGKEYRLGDFSGKTLVLEWFNSDCPFVKKHYGAGNMQALQEKYTKRGVVWLSVCSSAPGKQGNYPPDKMADIVRKLKGKQTAVLLDPSGKVGLEYGARTTPHMFVVGGDGKIIYNGAIDSIRSTRAEDIPKARNYVADALDETLAGKAVTRQASQPYGCSVKY